MSSKLAPKTNDLKFPVEDYADHFDVHVKTILRAVLNTPAPSDWAPEPLPVSRVAKAFNMEPGVLLAVMRGKEFLLDAEDACKDHLHISIRRFHQRRAQKPDEMKPVARHGRIVRYALTDIATFGDL